MTWARLCFLIGAVASVGIILTSGGFTPRFYYGATMLALNLWLLVML